MNLKSIIKKEPMLTVSLIIFVPLTILLFKAGKKEKYILPILTFENIAAIRGSLLTPFGSPQNLYIFSQSGISAPRFMLIMLPLWIASFFLLYVFILILFHKDENEEIVFEKDEITPSWQANGKFKRILLSQVISNVPASIVLWPFIGSETANLKALLYGLDSAGLCSLIGSLASVINLRLYSREFSGSKNTWNFIKIFTLISLAFFAVVVFPQWLLIKFS